VLKVSTGSKDILLRTSLSSVLSIFSMILAVARTRESAFAESSAPALDRSYSAEAVAHTVTDFSINYSLPVKQ